jgi:hypothetical protein
MRGFQCGRNLACGGDPRRQGACLISAFRTESLVSCLEVTSLAFDNNGKLASAWTRGTVWIADPAARTVVTRIKAAESVAWSLTFVGDGSTLLGAMGGRVQVWDSEIFPSGNVRAVRLR